MGYSDFIDEREMKYQERENQSLYLNEWSIYQEALDILKSDDEPKLLSLVTMQNHMPYDTPQYSELDFTMLGYNNELLEQNLQSLYYSDMYLGEFIEELDKLDEPTVVLWYGDHTASLLFAYADSQDKAERDLIHITPYFIYANFDIESPYTEEEVAEAAAELGFSFATEGVDLPLTTPNCLLNQVYNLLNIEKPALFYLLDEVCEEMPILSVAYYNESLSLETEVLKEYELVSYDVLSGKHYWDGK